MRLAESNLKGTLLTTRKTITAFVPLSASEAVNLDTTVPKEVSCKGLTNRHSFVTGSNALGMK